MAGTAGQLYFHLGAAMNTGLSETQMYAFIAILKAKVGQQEVEGAPAVLSNILSSRAE
jgi:hypothetical protein